MRSTGNSRRDTGRELKLAERRIADPAPFFFLRTHRITRRGRSQQDAPPDAVSQNRLPEAFNVGENATSAEYRVVAGGPRKSTASSSIDNGSGIANEKKIMMFVFFLFSFFLPRCAF